MAKLIREIVSDLFEKYSLTIPVDLHTITLGERINLAYEVMDDALSGLCMRNSNGVSIVINESHHPNRQRFTLAHELGHHFLHLMNSADDEMVFVDKASIYRRDSKSSTGMIKKEREANEFAAELLMPESIVMREINSDRFDVDNIEGLAKNFEVSIQAMSIRLATLGYN